MIDPTEVTSVATLLEIPTADPATYCRLCLSSAQVEPLFPANFRPELIQLIASNVQVVLAVDEDLPCGVCAGCRDKLEDFERFRERCRRLDEFFRMKRKEAMEAAATATTVVSEEISIKADPGVLLLGEDEEEEEDDESLPYVMTVDGWHRCKFCSEAFRSLSVLLEHFRMRHPDEARMYKCPSCCRAFGSQSGQSVGEPAYKCDQCDAGFSHRVGLARHRDRYHDESSPNYTKERFKCELCPAVFVDIKQRSRHQLEVHVVSQSKPGGIPQIDGIHVCEKCAVTFSPYQALLVHIQEHHWNDPPQETTFGCPVCAKCFDKRRLVQYHILVAHLGQIPYACNHCGEWFRTKSHLKQHKNIFHEQRASDGGAVAAAGRCDFCGQTLDEERDNQ